jgi:hypothetical protein
MLQPPEPQRSAASVAALFSHKVSSGESGDGDHDRARSHLGDAEADDDKEAGRQQPPPPPPPPEAPGFPPMRRGRSPALAVGEEVEPHEIVAWKEDAVAEGMAAAAAEVTEEVDVLEAHQHEHVALDAEQAAEEAAEEAEEAEPSAESTEGGDRGSGAAESSQEWLASLQGGGERGEFPGRR